MRDHALPGEQFLNRAIDAVAARMTAADPPADLRARVIGRIAARRPPAWTWMLKPAAALAIVAVAAVCVQVIRTSRPASIDRRQPPVAPLAGAMVATATAASVAAPVPDRAAAQPRRTDRTPAPPRISAAEAAWRERAIPALGAIEALSIDGIQPEALSVPQLEVKALTTTPLVAPTDGKGVR